MKCQRSLGSSNERSIVAAAGLISVFSFGQENRNMKTRTHKRRETC